MELYKKIQMLQEKMGWSVAELARKSGLAPTTIYSMYANATRPTEQTLERICHAFGIIPDQMRYDFEKPTTLTEEQKKLLEQYSLLDDEQKKALLNLMRVMK